MDLYGDLPAAKEDSVKKEETVDIFAMPAPVARSANMPPPSGKSMASSRKMNMLPPAALKKPGMVPANALKKKTTFSMPPPVTRNKPAAPSFSMPSSSSQGESMAPPSKPSPSEFAMPTPVKGGFTVAGAPAINHNLGDIQDTQIPMNSGKIQSWTGFSLNKNQDTDLINGTSTLGPTSAPVINIHSEEVSDPYDPARPNDYTAFCKERIAKKKEEERQRELQKYLEDQEKERAKLEEARRLAAEGLGPFNMGAAGSAGRGRAGRGRGVSNIPAWMAKQQQEKQIPPGGLPRPDGDPQQFADAPEGMGKNTQQFPGPEPRLPGGMAPPGGMMAPPKPKKKGLFSNPTKVVLLKNMVGPGEVDEDLAPETKEECSKYGPVKECVVHEETDKSLPIEEIVRTFVAFERQDAAIKAFMDMNGRFFAGRQITAVFYKEDKFDRRELSYTPGEGDS